MWIVCPHWERSSRYVDNVEKFLSQGVAFGIRHEPWMTDMFEELRGMIDGLFPDADALNLEEMQRGLDEQQAHLEKNSE